MNNIFRMENLIMKSRKNIENEIIKNEKVKKELE